jgi:2-methylcitrate dehydratase PrpD
VTTIEEQLVAHLSATTYETLPAEAVQAARKCIIDTLGITLAGSSGDDIDTLVQFLSSQGGKAEATVLGYGLRLPIVHAAWANAAMARAYECDDSHDASGEHVSVPILAAALATAEITGNVSGKQFITAYVLAADIVPRLRLARAANVGPFMSNTFAPFAAATVSGLLLGLRDRDLYHALGWAYAQCAGAVQLQQGGGSALHIHHGMACGAGIQAALLARRGLPGTEDFLTGKFGFYNAYDGGRVKLDAIVAELGRRFEITGVCTKQYPAGRVIHWPIEAALRLRGEEQFSPAEIESIEVAYTRNGYRMTCEPENERRTPDIPQHARFSLYYNVACALARGHVSIGDSTPTALKDEVVRELTRKIKVTFDPTSDAMLPPGDVTVVLKDSRRLRRTVDVLKGTVENPMSFAECAAKFRDCTRFARKPIREAVAGQVIERIRLLEEVVDMREIVSLLDEAVRQEEVT